MKTERHLIEWNRGIWYAETLMFSLGRYRQVERDKGLLLCGMEDKREKERKAMEYETRDGIRNTFACVKTFSSIFSLTYSYYLYYLYIYLCKTEDESRRDREK